MLPVLLWVGDLVRAAFSVYVTGAACLLAYIRKQLAKAIAKAEIFYIRVCRQQTSLNFLKSVGGIQRILTDGK
jgi:hypothetical protein